jgi:hypothetical protein
VRNHSLRHSAPSQGSRFKSGRPGNHSGVPQIVLVLVIELWPLLVNSDRCGRTDVNERQRRVAFAVTPGIDNEHENENHDDWATCRGKKIAPRRPFHAPKRGVSRRQKKESTMRSYLMHERPCGPQGWRARPSTFPDISRRLEGRRFARPWDHGRPDFQAGWLSLATACPATHIPPSRKT